EQTGTGTYTSGTSFTASVTSFTPTSGDLNYAYTGFLACSATGTITYATGFTAGTGKGTDATTATKCITAGSVKFQFNEADQYFPNTGTTATTASFAVADSAPTTNTGGWAEIVLQFKPTFANTASLSASVTMAPALTHITSIFKSLSASIQLASSNAEKTSIFKTIAATFTLTMGNMVANVDSGKLICNSNPRSCSTTLTATWTMGSARTSSFFRSLTDSLSLAGSRSGGQAESLSVSLGSSSSLGEKSSLFRSVIASLSLAVSEVKSFVMSYCRW